MTFTRPRSPTQHNHKELALWWLVTLDESSPQWVPARDTHGTLGPLRRKAGGGPNNAPKGEVTRHDAHHSNKTTDRSSDKHGSGAVTTTPSSTRQDAEGASRARDDQPAGTEDCRGTAGADREDDANDAASDGSECNDRAAEHSGIREHNSAHVRRVTRT